MSKNENVVNTKARDIKEMMVHLQRWQNGELSDYEASMLVTRTSRRLSKACYCADGVCCEKHGTHSTPHQNCILR